jgi:(2Fe-2S) ferredoxin
MRATCEHPARAGGRRTKTSCAALRDPPPVDGGSVAGASAWIDRPSRASQAETLVPRRFKIVICRGPECGGHRGSEALHDVFRARLTAHGAGDTEVAWQSCFGRCTQGPNILIREILTGDPMPMLGSGFATLPGPRGATALYNRMDTPRIERVVAEHVMKGQIVRDYIERPGIHPNDPVAARTKDS